MPASSLRKVSLLLEKVLAAHRLEVAEGERSALSDLVAAHAGAAAGEGRRLGQSAGAEAGRERGGWEAGGSM